MADNYVRHRLLVAALLSVAVCTRTTTQRIVFDDGGFPAADLVRGILGEIWAEKRCALGKTVFYYYIFFKTNLLFWSQY